MYATDSACQSLISLQGIQLNSIWYCTILDYQVLSLFTTTYYLMWEKHLEWAGIEPESSCSASNSSNHSTTGSSMTINCQHKKGNAGKFFYSLSIMLEKPISLEVSYFPFSLELPAAAARFDTRGFESALRHKTDAGFAISEKRRWGFSVPVEERSNQFNFFEFLFRLQLKSFLLLENLF